MNILQRLTEITDLPTLPEVMLRIHALIQSNECNASALARVIEQDPALSVRILKVANSSIYGNNNRISSIQFAITRLGFNEVSSIAMAVSVIKKLSRKSSILDYKQFWRHSLSAAFLATVTGKNLADSSQKQKSSFFLSGLLHDIGILIYDQFFPEQFEGILDYAMKHEISFLEAETKIAPKETHHAVGSALLEIWKMDVSVCSSVRFHHTPDKAPEQSRGVATAVHAAEYLLCNNALGSFEGMIKDGFKESLDYLGITSDALPLLMEDLNHEMDRSDLLCAIETSGDSLRAI